MAASKKKVNPRRKPATHADIQKAKKDATSEAISFAWAIMFTCLHDKEGWGKVRLQRLWAEVGELSDSVAKGYVSITDLKHTLKEEMGVELV